MRRTAGCLLSLVLLGCPTRTPAPGEPTATAVAETPAPTDRRVLGGGEIEAAPAPLTEAEVQQAAGIAMGELRKRNFADSRTFFVHAEMLHDKGGNARRALVQHYRYAGDQTITTIVDLSAGRVVDVRVAEHAPSALSREEFEEARKLAMADPRVQEALGANRGNVEVEPLVVRASQGDPLFGHRVVRLLFRRGRDYLTAPDVHVDLTDRKVMVRTPPPQPNTHM